MILQRQHPRYALAMNVEVTDGQRSLAGKTQDISSGGCSVLSRSPMTVGREHSLNLTLPGQESGAPLQLEAIVVWCTRVETGFLAGLKFVNPTSDTAKQLARIVALAAAAAPANDNQHTAPRATAEDEQLSYTLEDLGVAEGFTVAPSSEDEHVVSMVRGHVVDHFWSHRPDPLAFPHLATQIVDALENPELELGKLVDLIRQEPAVAASLLKAANSPLFRRGAPAPDLATAVTKLGLRLVGQLAAGVACAALFDIEARTELSLHAARWREMFHRSLTCAMASAWLAERCRLPQPDRAFSAGMLHDVGRSLALRSLSALQISGRVPSNLSEPAVDGVLDRTHVELGAEMHVAWSLPAYLTETCLHHHDPVVEDKPDNRIIHVIRVVSGLTTLRVQPSYAREQAPLITQSLKVLGIERAGLPVLRQQIDDAAAKVDGIIGSHV
jgi:HD-like signal output (HDOD) protein